MHLDAVAIGKRIKQLRKIYGLTQEQISGQLNISDSYFRKLESGKRYASVELYVDLAQKLGVSLDYLLLGKENASNSLKREIRMLIATLNDMLMRL